jgi:hypothetical protein
MFSSNLRNGMRPFSIAILASENKANVEAGWASFFRLAVKPQVAKCYPVSPGQMIDRIVRTENVLRRGSHCA